MSKSEPAATAHGPHGGHGGSPWDDGVRRGIKQIVVVYGSDAIYSIRFEYAGERGHSSWSEKHGGNGNGGGKTETIELKYPHETLVSVKGHFGLISPGSPVIRSLTFETSEKKSSTIGVEQGTPFSLPSNQLADTATKIVGFHGRSGWFLDSIGVYVKGKSRRRRWLFGNSS